jgi:hypothetical protein
MNLYASVACDCVSSLLVRQKKNQVRLSVRSHSFRSRTKSALTNLCNRPAFARLRVASARRAECCQNWMARDQFKRAFKQFFSRRDLVPRRCPRGVRQWNHIEAVPGALNSKSATNHLLQFRAIDELRDSQPAHGNNETRSQNLDLVIHPRGTVVNLVRSGNPICASRILAGKTTADRCEINSRSNGRFVHAAEFFEPTEERFSSGMRKRPLQDRLTRPGSLPNDHHIADNRTARNWCGLHPRAATTAKKLSDMLL